MAALAIIVSSLCLSVYQYFCTFIGLADSSFLSHMSCLVMHACSITQHYLLSCDPAGPACYVDLFHQHCFNCTMLKGKSASLSANSCCASHVVHCQAIRRRAYHVTMQVPRWRCKFQAHSVRYLGSGQLAGGQPSCPGIAPEVSQSW